MRPWKRWIVLALAGVAAACGSDDPVTGPEPTGTANPGGGVVTSADGVVTLEFPPGAVAQPTPITVERIDSPPAGEGLLPGTAYQFGPAGTIFQQPVTLRIRYDAGALPAGAPPAVAIHRRTGPAWVRVPGGSVQPGNTSVEAPLVGFSLYAVLFLGVPGEAVVEGDAPAAVAGSTLPAPPALIVRSAGGVPLPGVQVTFSVHQGGGSITGPVQLTDGEGRAAPGSWTLGPVPGANVLRATVQGLDEPVFVNAEGTVGPPATLTFIAGAGQAAYPGEQVTVSPRVRVTDAAGFPVSGTGVSFSADKGGSVNQTLVTTDTDGVATVIVWRLGDRGTNTLTATVADLSASITAETLDPCTRASQLDPLSLSATTLLNPGRACLLAEGRVADLYSFTTGFPRVLAATLSSADFGPFVGAYSAGGPAGGGYEISGTGRDTPGAVAAEHVLPTGTYWFAASTQATDAASPPGGLYTFSLAFRSEPQDGCIPATWVTHGSTANGRIAANDCDDPLNQDQAVVRRVDEYAMLVFAGQTVTATISANFPVSLNRFSGGQFLGGVAASSGQPATLSFTAAATAVHHFAVLNAESGGTGNYSVQFSTAGGAAASAVGSRDQAPDRALRPR